MVQITLSLLYQYVQQKSVENLLDPRKLSVVLISLRSSDEVFFIRWHWLQERWHICEGKLVMYSTARCWEFHL
jgi:hypothetical protein